MLKKHRFNSNFYIKIVKLSQETFWVFFGQVVIMTGNFFLLNKLTKSLSPSHYGLVTIMMSIAALSNSLLIGGVNQSIFRYYSISIDDESPLSYRKDSIKLLFSSLLLLSTLYVPFLIYFAINTNWNFFVLSILLYIYSVFFNFNNSIITVFNAARKRLITAILSGAEVLLKICFVLLLIYFGTLRIETLLISYFAAMIMIVIIGYNILIFFFKSSNLKNTNHKKYKSEMFKFSLPFLYWGAFISVQQLSDRFSLSFFKSTQDVGYYSVIFQIGYAPINILFSVISSVLSPIIYLKAGNISDQNKIDQVKKILSLALILGLFLLGLIFLFAYFLHAEIFEFSVGNEFWCYSYLMPWLILPAGLFALGELLGLFFSTMKIQKKIVPIKIGTSIFAILANVAGAYFYGIIGIIFSLNIFSIIYLFSMYIQYKKFNY